MVQLHQDYNQFRELHSEVVVIVPNGPKMIEKYIRVNKTPYLVLSDRGSVVAAQYGIKTRNALLLTTMKPTVFLVDRSGIISYSNYQRSYIKEPDNREPLALLSRITA